MDPKRKVLQTGFGIPDLLPTKPREERSGHFYIHADQIEKCNERKEDKKGSGNEMNEKRQRTR